MTTFRLPFLVLIVTATLWGCTEHQFREMEGERIIREYEESMQRAPARRTGNVTIVVDRILLDRNDSAQASVAWRYADERIAVGSDGGRLARHNGIRIGVVNEGFAAKLRSTLERIKNKETTRTTLAALSGHPAAIMVGQDTYVPIVRYRTFLGERVVLQRAFIGASLVIEPTILPEDRVRVKLHPRLTARDGKSIDLTEATTEVVVRHGQPLLIGGMEQSTDSAGFAMFSYDRRRRHRKLTMIVTPYIQGAP